ncbi:hypothetical protein GCM10027190_21110 [Spirosoma areae]
MLLPAFDQWVGFSSSFKSTEKRILTPFPTFNFPHVKTYIHEFNQYYRENFGWRNALFYQYSQLKYRLMDVSPLPQKVILGKHNWFYPGNSLNNVANQHQGLLPITPATLQAIASRLTTHQQELATLGIHFYVMVAPDSYTIYPENLPAYIRRNPLNSNFDCLKRHLAKYTTIPLIDVRVALRNAKSTHLTYCQTDTHWNDYGALIASLTAIRRVRQDFPCMPMPILQDYKIRAEEGAGGDLVTMLALNREITDSVNYSIQPPCYLKSRQTESRESSPMKLPSQRFVSINKNLPNLLLVGDSFGFAMAKFVPGYFSESYFVYTNSLKKELIRSEKPDAVVIVIVERNLTDLARL